MCEKNVQNVLTPEGIPDILIESPQAVAKRARRSKPSIGFDISDLHRLKIGQPAEPGD